MNLSEIKEVLKTVDEIGFQLPDGSKVPDHFHVTEIGRVDKRFIDCGGTMRTEQVINFQLWSAHDYDHRLIPNKLIEIIEVAEKALDLDDQEVEVEYQSDTIGRYGLAFNNGSFILQTKLTNCLAPDKCGIPIEKPRIRLSTLNQSKEASCDPGSGCC